MKLGGKCHIDACICGIILDGLTATTQFDLDMGSAKKCEQALIRYTFKRKRHRITLKCVLMQVDAPCTIALHLHSQIPCPPGPPVSNHESAAPGPEPELHGFARMVGNGAGTSSLGKERTTQTVGNAQCVYIPQQPFARPSYSCV